MEVSSCPPTIHPFIHPFILMVHKGAAGVCWVSQPSFLVVYSLSLSLSLSGECSYYNSAERELDKRIRDQTHMVHFCLLWVFGNPFTFQFLF
jgi:hypothetical protein